MAEPVQDENIQEPLGSALGSAAEERIAALEAELTDARDQLLRSLAEQQNIRRIMQRERDEAAKFAVSSLAGDLLDTLDNLHRAIVTARSGDAGQGQLLTGVEATERGLLAVLAKHGIWQIDPLGEMFDPHQHQAVFRQPGPEDGRIVEVLQPGYMLHDRLLRPAMVGVTSATA